jgi:hypothetical protein
VVGTFWMLATALDTISRMVVAIFVIIVSSDVAAKWWGLGLRSRSRGCRGCRELWVNSAQCAIFSEVLGAGLGLGTKQ